LGDGYVISLPNPSFNKMSQPNQTELKEEWLNQAIDIKIFRADGQFILRSYRLNDGQVPTEIGKDIQEVVDTLLDTSEL
jgi:hypothetical protein